MRGLILRMNACNLSEEKFVFRHCKVHACSRHTRRIHGPERGNHDGDCYQGGTVPSEESRDCVRSHQLRLGDLGNGEHVHIGEICQDINHDDRDCAGD